jgi:zinc/manganese transport system substrate-binding protein
MTTGRLEPAVNPRARILPRLVLGGVAVACTLGLTGCGGSSAASTSAASGGSSGPIAVVAGENFWGSIASQIGGAHVKVTSIISDPNTDPHEYETDPNDAAAVARARFVIENGVGYDSFLADQLKNSGSKQVLDIQQLVGVTGSDPNPHLWYSPTYVQQAAAAIEKQLAADDPADADTFAANLATFLKAYQPYLTTIAEIKSRYDGAAISYTERVPGYLVDAAGLHLGTPASFSQAVEDGTDPTPADTAAFNADLAQHKVKVLLYNSQVVDVQTTKIKATATSAGIPIVGVSETIPSQFANFQDWQIAQAKALLAALGG